MWHRPWENARDRSGFALGYPTAMAQKGTYLKKTRFLPKGKVFVFFGVGDLVVSLLWFWVFVICLMLVLQTIVLKNVSMM